MKKIFLALLFLTFPALAATVTTVADTSQPNTVSLVATNDAVCFNHYYGTKWATVRWTVSTAGSGGITTEYSKDGGTNFLPLPYSTLTSTVAVNPSTAPWANNTPVAGSYETPVPGNTTDVCVRYQTAGTSTVISLSSGLPYSPNAPVVATIYDATVTAGGANNTGTLDGSGWSSLSWHLVVATATTGALSVNEVDDAGNALAVASVASLVVGTYAGGLGVGVSMGTAITPLTGLTQVALPKRFNFALAGATTSSIRLRAQLSR